MLLLPISSFLLVFSSFVACSMGAGTRPRLPIGLASFDVVIQYTLNGEDTTAQKWGGDSAEEGEAWNINSTGTNLIAAAAVVAAPNSVDTKYKVIKVRLEPVIAINEFHMLGSFKFGEEIDMQAARIIWGPRDIECFFDRAGFENELHPPELTFGKTLEFPWDTIDVPVGGITCKSPDVLVGSELV